MKAILECRELTKQYQQVKALDHLNLALEPGRIVGLLGPNGSGKTTLLKTIGGILTPTSGEIQVDGTPVGLETKKLVSYLPDWNYLSDWMRVRDVIGLFKDFYADFDDRKALEMLSRLKINSKDRLKSMSKGTKEKVQLVLVMSRRARLYLLDEPIGGVDPAARDYILTTLIGNYSENATILISTHLIADVEQVLGGTRKIGRCFVSGGIQMLGKLMKYEWKATVRIFLPLYGAILLFALITRLFWEVNSRYTPMEIPAFMSALLYSMLILGTFAVTVFVMIQRFYKSLLGHEGYLMFTLPVQPYQHILSKLIVAFLWIVASFLWTLLSVFFMAVSPELLYALQAAVHSFLSQITGIGWQALAGVLVMLLASLAAGILMVYTASAIGHLSGRHRLLCSFAAYLGLNFAVQFLNLMVILIWAACNSGSLFGMQPLLEINTVPLGIQLIWSFSGIYVLYAVVFFIVTNLILKRKLNLE